MIVIKFGGHAMTDEEGLFAKAVQGALDLGEECIIVHGGGPQIDRALKAANVEPEFKGGFRVTSPEFLGEKFFELLLRNCAAPDSTPLGLPVVMVGF
jgi:acetylglutamate kinase